MTTSGANDPAGGRPTAMGAGGVGEKYGFPSPYDLDDDSVKLVAYTIVSIKRDAERVMPRGAGSIVVTESMTPEAFATWRIADYLASDGYRDLAAEEKLQPGDRKHLRVDYVVSRRWPRQSRNYESAELAALEGIRKKLAED